MAKNGKEYVKNPVKKAPNKAKIIDYIYDCGKTQISIFFASLTATLCLLNPSSRRETLNEPDQSHSLKQIYNLFRLPFRAADLNSLFFEGINNVF